MKTRLIKSGLTGFLVVIILLTLFQSTSCSDEIPYDSDLLLTIVGKVTDFETGLPIEGATLKLFVTIKPKVDDVLGTATTNSNGDYKLTGKHNCHRVPQVLADANGYYDDHFTVHCKEEQQTVDFQLRPQS